MQYIDSWVWLTYFADDRRSKPVEKMLYEIEAGEKTVFSTLGLTEVVYRLRQKVGKETSERILFIMNALKGLILIPVTEEIAMFASELRIKYYDRKACPFSYADAVHLSTALLTGCDCLYTGDPDFSGIDEDIKIELIF